MKNTLINYCLNSPTIVYTYSIIRLFEEYLNSKLYNWYAMGCDIANKLYYGENINIHTIKYISNDNKKQLYFHNYIKSISPLFDLNNLSLKDIHYILKENNFTDMGFIEILYSINNNRYFFVYPIYIDNNNYNYIELINCDNIKAFPMSILLSANKKKIVYSIMNCQLLNEDIVSIYAPELVEMYSGYNHDFYENKYISTISKDGIFVDVPYKFTSKMIQLNNKSLTNDNIIDDVELIISIEILYDDCDELIIEN